MCSEDDSYGDNNVSESKTSFQINRFPRNKVMVGWNILTDWSKKVNLPSVVGSRNQATQTEETQSSEASESFISKSYNFLNANKKKTAIIGGCAAAAVVTPIVILPVLGFTSTGVAAGSVAAAAQSAAYGGATCGAFSALQSAGAAGMAITTKVAFGTAGGFTGYLTTMLGKKKEADSQENGPSPSETSLTCNHRDVGINREIETEITDKVLTSERDTEMGLPEPVTGSRTEDVVSEESLVSKL